MSLQIDLPLPVTFRRIGLQGAECSAGFAVRMAGGFEIDYIEGDHVLPIDHVVPVDMHDSLLLVIHKDAIRSWKPPFDGEVISRAERDQIVRRIAAALDFLGERYEFV
jgi:hypothetical protein